jgi:hypothetical protein
MECGGGGHCVEHLFWLRFINLNIFSFQTITAKYLAIDVPGTTTAKERESIFQDVDTNASAAGHVSITSPFDMKMAANRDKMLIPNW